MPQGYRKVSPNLKREYLNWFLTPPAERDPKTKQAMADELGVTLRTLYNWEATDEFQAEARKIKTKWGARFHGDILGRLMGIVSSEHSKDSDAISAARVLLGHLHVDTDEKAGTPEDEQVEAIRKILEDQGYSVISRESSGE